MVLRCGELVGVDSLGMERIGQHGFPCSLRHPSPPLSGVGSYAPAPCGDGGPGPGTRALPGPTFAAPRAACEMGGAVALGGGVSVGVGVCDGVMGTGGSGGPGGVLIVLCRGGAWEAGA